MKPHVLLIDDDRSLCQIIMEHLSHDLYNFDVAYSGKKGIELAEKKRPDLIIIDFQMPEMDGLETIGEIHKIYPNLPFIFLTGFSSVDTAVEVMKLGAIDYIQKPFHSERLKITVRNAVKTVSLAKEVENLKYIVKDHLKLDKIVGSSKATEDLKKMLRKTFNVDSTVLILGESGTGKELVARTIHENTLIRDTSKYVAVNCASLPENLLESELFGHEKGAFTGATELKIGKFEYANGGTLFLDEICEMSFQTQAKLMRVLQEREIQRLGSNDTIPVDLRILAATNKDIEQYVRDGKFREDLYFRLNVFPIHLLPLRQRVTDIEELVRYTIEKLNKKFNKIPEVTSISDSCLKALNEYHWPGNVRELQNVIERSMIETETDKLEESHLPNQVTDSNHPKSLQINFENSLNLPEVIEETERTLINKALEKKHFNLSETAKSLHISRSTLYRKMEQYKIDLPKNAIDND